MSLVSVEWAQRYVQAYRPEDEDFLLRLLNAAEAVVVRKCGRKLEPEPALVDGQDIAPAVTKFFRLDRRGEARIPDLRTADVVSVGGMLLLNTPTTEAYELTQRDDEPATHIRVYAPGGAMNFGLSPYMGGGPLRVSITGRWGFNPPPAEAVDAIYRLAARMWAEKDARYSDNVQAGIESTAFAYYRELPATVKGAIEGLRVHKVALV